MARNGIEDKNNVAPLAFRQRETILNYIILLCTCMENGKHVGQRQLNNSADNIPVPAAAEVEHIIRNIN